MDLGAVKVREHVFSLSKLKPLNLFLGQMLISCLYERCWLRCTCFLIRATNMRPWLTTFVWSVPPPPKKKPKKTVKCEGRVITVGLRGNRRGIQEVATVRSKGRKLCIEKNKVGNKMCAINYNFLHQSNSNNEVGLKHIILIFKIGHIYKYIILIAIISNSCMFVFLLKALA